MAHGLEPASLSVRSRAVAVKDGYETVP
jgi:hypothetical protein